MIKHPLILTSFALVIGVVLGFFLLFVENYAAKELIGLLAHEVESAGPYKLEYDSADMSLFTLKAQAKNARITENGKIRVLVPILQANFSLWKIRQKIATLDELKMIGAKIDGITSDSAIVRVIDYIITPLPPEQASPFTIELQKLILTPSKASQSLGELDLKAEGIQIIMKRTGIDDFDLNASAKKIALVSNIDKQSLLPITTISDIKTNLFIADEYIDIKKFSAQFIGGQSLGAINIATNKNDLLSGNITTVANQESFGINSDLIGNIETKTELSGHLNTPESSSKISTTDISLLSSFFANQLRLSKIDAILDASYSDQGVNIFLKELIGLGENLNIELDQPLHYESGKLSGSLKLRANSLETKYGNFSNLIAKLNFGSVSGTQISIEANTPSNFPIKQVNGQCELLQKKILCSIASENKKLLAQAKILLRPNSLPLLESSTLEFSGDSEFLGAAKDKIKFINIKATASGPLSSELIQSDGQIVISNLPLIETLNANLSIKNGILAIQSENNDKNLIINISSTLSDKGTTRIKATAKSLLFPVGGSKEVQGCSTTSFSSELTFPGLEYSQINGSISIDNLAIGCSPYALRLSQPLVLGVDKSSITLPHVVFKSTSGELKVDGKISVNSGFAIKALGEANLSALLPITSQLDELSGQVSLNLDLNGPITKPKITGNAQLSDTMLEVESPPLQISEAQGQAILNGRMIELHNVSGSLNGGTFLIAGGINLDSIAASDLHLNFNKVAFNPIREAEFISSGKLDLSDLGNRQPTISGVIQIESAQIEKRFDLIKLARDLSKQLIGIGSKKIEISSAAVASPVKLDLNMIAPSSLFFDSNFAEAEAKADLHISGAAFSPTVEGDVEILQGWFGLRDRRFDIGSGKIIFSASKADPDLDIIAETSVFSRQGENVVIFASIKGAITSPQIKFDSDRGYTEREIVQLLTTGSDITSTNRGMGMFSQDFNLDVPFVSDDSFFGLGRWLRRLTKIDSLSIEPTFNSQSGVIEPTLIADKYIWPNLTLRGETSFGSAGNDARARLNYAISPRVTVSGIIDALAAQQNTALGVDLSYALKPQRSKFLRTSIQGNIFLTTDSILNNLKLTEDSRVTQENLARLNELVRKFYLDNGFPYSSVELSCGETLPNQRCRNLNITISEGDKLSVNRIESEGDALPVATSQWIQSQQNQSQTATRMFKEQFTENLTARLRNEGYIRSRVNAYYQENTNPTILKVSVILGKPVSFIFSGNNAFSNEVLLSSINIFGRKQPFGNNTINLLVTNIERLYSQNGFPYATISWSSFDEDQTDRTIYNIKIDEGKQLSLDRVNFEGLEKISKDELKKQLSKVAGDRINAILHPPKIMAEAIEDNCQIIQSTLIYNGFEDARVSYHLSEYPDREKADLIYEIVEGGITTIKELEINGMPNHISVELPDKPYTRKKIELLKEDLTRLLNIAGYRKSQILESNSNNQSINLTVIPGSPTIIGNISIEGLEEISRSLIESKLIIHSGQTWNEDEVAKSRQAILRTGLFKKVEIKAKQDMHNSNIEDAIISLEERNLSSIQVGAGVNSEYGVHLFGLITNRRYFSDGRSISARIDTYFDQIQGQISQGVMSANYTDPEFIQSQIGFVSDLRFQRLDQTSLEFNLDRVSHSGYLHKNFDDNISASLGHTLLIENLDNVNPGAILDPDFDTGTVRIGYIQGNFLFDYRDNPLNPRNGYAISLSPEIAGKALGSEANFAGIDLHAAKILPLEGEFERFSLALIARAASAWTYGGSEDIPISQRYYLGGRTSVRGFRENSLGPKSEDGAIIGGDELLTQSIELRYLLEEDFTLDLFLDSGRLQLREYQKDGEEMRYSAGVGARYLSPIGPIGFDIGFPLNEKSGEPSARFHFNIGANF